MKNFKGVQRTAQGILLTHFAEIFDGEIEFDLKPDGSIVWSHDVTNTPDWEERLEGWWDMLFRLEKKFNDLGYNLEVQEDSEFFGGQLTLREKRGMRGIGSKD